MAEAEAIRRKRDVLAAELYAYFWLTSNELTARGTEAMLRLPPFVLRDLAVELQGFEAVTNRANQELVIMSPSQPTPPVRQSERSLYSGVQMISTKSLGILRSSR